MPFSDILILNTIMGHKRIDTMQAYQSKKIVHAEPMTSTQWIQTREQHKGVGYSDATLEEGLAGYTVCYNKGTDKEYWSWSPKDVFEKDYSLKHPIFY